MPPHKETNWTNLGQKSSKIIQEQMEISTLIIAWSLFIRVICAKYSRMVGPIVLALPYQRKSARDFPLYFLLDRKVTKKLANRKTLDHSGWPYFSKVYCKYLVFQKWSHVPLLPVFCSTFFSRLVIVSSNKRMVGVGKWKIVQLAHRLPAGLSLCVTFFPIFSILHFWNLVVVHDHCCFYVFSGVCCLLWEKAC